ncbi:MAG: efflux RND transporter permease subunit [Patescibacteria group bacterium]|jgi:HAE1 family hydrophobic/amphiphilic exporter-1|nr:efflux RND transporter permease subunit [Patescibacteria group bacterium]
MPNFTNHQNTPTDSQSTENLYYDPHSQERIKKQEKGVLGFFIRRERITILLIIAIVILGLTALVNIPLESDPEVKIPYAMVTTVFPGASPADVEDLVTDKIESKLEELDGVKLVTSNSTLGVSSVFIEFEASADLEDSINDLEKKVDEVNNLPDEARDPIVQEIRVDDTPIITFSLAGNIAETELKNIAEDIQNELEKIPGISEVDLLGARDREFSITVNEGALNQLNISLSQVVGAIAAANADMPLGDITINQTNYNIRLVAKINSLEDLKKTVITIVGNPILLTDIAEVEDSLTDRHTISRMSLNDQPAAPTISLQLRKKTGGNILNIVDSAKEKIDQLRQNGTIPPEVAVDTNNDYSQFIREDVQVLGSSGIQSIILIFAILFLALSIREAVISLVAIPMTFLITVIVLHYIGYTLNSLVMFSLVLSLGLLVDAFIIILEGIFHNMRSGFQAKEAALLSISHYRNPLLSGTFTTIAAFVPMLLVSGIMGEYIKYLPITISIALLSALFVSLSIVPAVATVILKRKNGSFQQKETYLEKFLTTKLTRIYKKKIEALLKSRRQKIYFVASVTTAFFIALGLLISPIIPVELFPEVDVDFAMIDIEMPQGTNLERTSEVAALVENYLYQRDDIKSFVTSIGQSSSFGFSTSQSREHLANVNITFVEEKQRHQKSYEINNEMREDLKSIAQGKITIREISGGPPSGSPIEARISGDNLETIDQISKKLIKIFESTEGVIEVESDKTVSPADITFTLNKDALARSGLSVGEVSSVLRTAIFGITATEINIDGEDIDVVVRLKKDNLNSVEQLKNLSLQNNFGQSVKLSRIADFSLEPALSAINHRDFKRVSVVQANLEEGYNSTVISKLLEQKVQEENILPKDYAIEFGGEVEDIDQSFSELWNSMFVAILLILLILVLQFNSFRQPFIILLTLPLAIIGVVVGMLLFGLSFGMTVFIGIIALAGIVVNDAIVLIDKALRNVKELNMKPRQAIMNAGCARLQPILLTSITTIAGVFPLIFANEMWLGFSIAIIFGLLFATILQLFFLPIVFLKLEGKKILKQVNQNS